MTDIKELATLTAAEMDDIYLRNVPAIILEQYAARLIAAYLAEQEPVVRVVDGGGELHLPKLQWVSANHSLETPIGSTLFTAPSEPAIPDGCVVVPKIIPMHVTDQLFRLGYNDSMQWWDAAIELVAAGEVSNGS